VACQGVEGAYSQIACEKMFKNPFIMYFKNFEAVFTAIEQGLCQYGILPIENSTAGSVKKVYDLMIKRNFSIVRTFRLKIDHNLLAKPGAKIEQIREVYSHEQALNQCSEFLAQHPNIKIVPVENTAIAAQMVAQSDRADVAAISSRNCAELYSLNCLVSGVQDKGNNRTRFICISKNLEIYPGSDKTSIMMVLNHRPGALYKVLARLYTLGINVTKLESRPIPDREFEFMFYFDLETSIYSNEFVQLMCELDELCEEFKYLGSYTEVV
jgi:chorismate mutase/prephenate dehydratase